MIIGHGRNVFPMWTFSVETQKWIEICEQSGSNIDAPSSKIWEGREGICAWSQREPFNNRCACDICGLEEHSFCRELYHKREGIVNYDPCPFLEKCRCPCDSCQEKKTHHECTFLWSIYKKTHNHIVF